MALDQTAPDTSLAALRRILPFWLSFALIPLVWIGAIYGGWLILLPPLASWHLFIILDRILGLNLENPDPLTPEQELTWYNRLTIAWVPAQAVTLMALIAYVSGAAHLSGLEKFGVFFGMGVLSGTIGINYSHELMHQKSRLERWLGDILLAMVLYSHFRSEHLLVHHRYVGTPKDPVTARYNEDFYRFFPVYCGNAGCLPSTPKKTGWPAKPPLAPQKQPVSALLGLASRDDRNGPCAGGLTGLVLFVVQAWVAISQLELVNYVEHYGLTRKHLSGGKIRACPARHSWNAAQKASNWLLINLQRHSDHHIAGSPVSSAADYTDAEARNCPMLFLDDDGRLGATPMAAGHEPPCAALAQDPLPRDRRLVSL